MNWLQWLTVLFLGLSCIFLLLATLNIRLTGRILAGKKSDFLDRTAEALNSLLP
jgi:hypothetical protein